MAQARALRREWGTPGRRGWRHDGGGVGVVEGIKAVGNLRPGKRDETVESCRQMLRESQEGVDKAQREGRAETVLRREGENQWSNRPPHQFLGLRDPGRNLLSGPQHGLRPSQPRGPRKGHHNYHLGRQVEESQ